MTKTPKLIKIPVEVISNRILIIRNIKVILDFDLAKLYQVTTKRLNEQVKRNLKRFPVDFMFRLTKDENDSLNRSQFATGSGKHRNLSYPPYAFTEHGVAMLSAILNSERAIEMSISIVRAFILIRELLITNKDLSVKIEKLEREQNRQEEHVTAIRTILKQLIDKPQPKNNPIGYSRTNDVNNLIKPSE